VLTADLLLYTLTGDLKFNPYLLDGDVVRVPFEELAATIGGAVVGAVAGHQVEKHVGTATDTVYRVNVRLDDGRLATVTQRDVSSLRVGARAQVANDMATPY